jgi:Zn-dependent alcohol dehydrogenase
VQGARLAGAACIVASDPIGARREAARALGATDVLDPSREDVVARALELTGVGFDYAFETAGRGKLVDTALAAVRNGGTVVCVGAPPLEETVTILPAVFVLSGKRILASVLGGSNSLREIPRLVALWQAGRLDLESLITARRPLREVNQALGDLRAGRGIRTVLDV